MKKTLFGLIVALAAIMLLTACCNNDSSCPVITADFTVDSFIDTDYSIEAPVLSKEYRASVIELSKKCKPGFVYDAEMSCRLISDTTYFLGFIRNIESRNCCEITSIRPLGRIDDGGLTMDVKGIGEFTESNGYFVLFPDGVGCSYPWAAYVADKADEHELDCFLSKYKAEEYHVFLFNSNWDYCHKIN